MSVEALLYVRGLQLGMPARKLVLMSLADRADEVFSCYPGVPLISAECEMSARQVQRHTAWLRKYGYMSDKERWAPDGSQLSNRYYLHGPWDNFGGSGRPFERVAYPDRQPIDGEFRIGTKAAGGGVIQYTRGVSYTTPPPRHPVHPGDVGDDTPPPSSATPLDVPGDIPWGALDDTQGVYGVSPKASEEASEETASPPSVGTAEVRAGGRAEEQKGPASPDDLSPATAGGAAGPSPTGGPAVAKSAATTKAVDRMAADVVRTLPRVLQPATDDERGAIHWLIADKLAVGYPVGVVRQALNADPPDHVKVKTAFVGHRLDQMAPWVPPARAASDTAAVDEIRGRESIRANDDQQRARREEIRQQVQAQKAQQQGKSGGKA